MKTTNDDLICNICHKNAKGVYKLANELVCFKCYDDIFNNANPAKVSKYIKSLHKKIDESTEMLDSYHEICQKYEAYCDESELKYTDTLNKIKELIRAYSKGKGLNVYNEIIKPVLTHIDYFIEKGLSK